MTGRVAIVLAAALLAALAMRQAPAWAQDRFGLADPAQVERFEAELNDILLAPPLPGQRAFGGKQMPDDPEIARILGGDNGLAEAWRADPRATLALIERIRQAGGLSQ